MKPEQNDSEIPIEEIKRQLLNKLSIEEDDLKMAHVTTDEEIRKFYKEAFSVAEKMSDKDVPLVGKEKVDKYKLTKKENEELEDHLKREKKTKKKREIFEAAVDKVKGAVEGAVKKAEFNSADQSHLPEKDRVSYEEAQQAIKDLGTLDLDDLE